MGALVRMKAAGVLLLAKRAIAKEAEKVPGRHKKIQDALNLAREKNDAELAEKITHMRSFADTFGGAYKDQGELINKVDVVKDKSAVLKRFLQDMEGLQSRINTFTRLYKDKKKEVQAMIKKGDNGNKFASFVVWANGDSPSAELAKFFGQLLVSIGEAMKS